jgi:hypothetical protein
MSTEEKKQRLSPLLRRLLILKLWLIEKFRFGERQVTLVWAAVIGILGVLILVIVKLIATSVAFGSGAVGGVFTPTLFFGSAIGVLYGQAVLYFTPQLQPDPTSCDHTVKPGCRKVVDKSTKKTIGFAEQVAST